MFFLNVNTIVVAETLWKEPMIVKSINKPTEIAGAIQYFDQFGQMGLPYGWSGKKLNKLEHSDWSIILFSLLGWLITALATLFGAPFWFDTLQKFVRLRGAGPS